MAKRATPKQKAEMDRDIAKILHDSAVNALREIRVQQRRLAKLIPLFKHKIAQAKVLKAKGTRRGKQGK